MSNHSGPVILKVKVFVADPATWENCCGYLDWEFSYVTVSIPP